MAKVCKNFDDVAEIVPNQLSTRIKVRVLRLWKIPSFLNPSEISSIEMVLIDEKVSLVFIYCLCCLFGLHMVCSFNMSLKVAWHLIVILYRVPRFRVLLGSNCCICSFTLYILMYLISTIHINFVVVLFS
jgi:hypothetical protein